METGEAIRLGKWCWQTYILSEGDNHRLSHLQEWVKGREKILSACLKKMTCPNMNNEARII